MPRQDAKVVASWEVRAFERPYRDRQALRGCRPPVVGDPHCHGDVLDRRAKRRQLALSVRLIRLELAERIRAGLEDVALVSGHNSTGSSQPSPVLRAISDAAREQT